MDQLVNHIMEDSEVKSGFSGADTSSLTSNDDQTMLSLIDMISSKQGNLLDLLIALKKYHTDGDVDQRVKSLNVISTVIHEVADLGLDSKAVWALSSFFVSKLKDVHWVLPSLRAIHAIIKYHPLTVKSSQQNGDGCLTIILGGMAPESMHIPAYNQKVRITAFKCFEHLMNNYNEFFKLQGEDIKMEVDNGNPEAKPIKIPYTNVISAVLTAIESEKDPRNLLLSFELTRVVLKMVGNDENSFKTIEPFIEEIFENISCYYPIEFDPPKNDKFQITSKELKDRLNNCFVASPYLSSHAFPFILEKLTSAIAFTKKESLRTLQRMINELPIQNVREFSEIIWNHLQNEAFNSFDEAVQTECINTISLHWWVLVNTKERFSTVQYDSITEKVITEVFQRCQKELDNDPDTLIGIMSWNLLSEIMKKSAVLCLGIVNSFVIELCIGTINLTQIRNP
jgi:DNA repair/transcription protein MET18/MMS19